MKRNPEWWWRDSYDENGEVGEQAKWDGSSKMYRMFKSFFGM